MPVAGQPLHPPCSSSVGCASWVSSCREEDGPEEAGGKAGDEDHPEEASAGHEACDEVEAGAGDEEDPEKAGDEDDPED